VCVARTPQDFFSFSNFIKMIEIQHNILDRVVKTDNRPEFMLHNFYASKGITRKNSCVKTP